MRRSPRAQPCDRNTLPSRRRWESGGVSSPGSDRNGCGPLQRSASSQPDAEPPVVISGSHLPPLFRGGPPSAERPHTRWALPEGAASIGGEEPGHIIPTLQANRPFRAVSLLDLGPSPCGREAVPYPTPTSSGVLPSSPCLRPRGSRLRRSSAGPPPAYPCPPAGDQLRGWRGSALPRRRCRAIVRRAVPPDDFPLIAVVGSPSRPPLRVRQRPPRSMDCYPGGRAYPPQLSTGSFGMTFER